MLEVLFSDSAAGSMKVGMCRGSEIGGCVGVIATDEKGRPVSPEETARLQRETKRRSGAAGRKPCLWREIPGTFCPFPWR